MMRGMRGPGMQSFIPPPPMTQIPFVPKEINKEGENKLESQQVATKSKEQIDTTSLIETLSNMNSYKFQNSKFLRFLKRMNKGAYEISDNQLIKHKELYPIADQYVPTTTQNKSEELKEDSKLEKLWENEDIEYLIYFIVI